MPLTIPVQQEVTTNTLTHLFPKELGLPSLEGEMLGSQNWKKESDIVVAKRQRKEKAHENRTKEGTRTRVGISGETSSLPG